MMASSKNQVFSFVFTFWKKVKGFLLPSCFNAVCLFAECFFAVCLFFLAAFLLYAFLLNAYVLYAFLLNAFLLNALLQLSPLNIRVKLRKNSCNMLPMCWQCLTFPHVQS